MNGCNAQFIGSPEVFVRANIINNIRWFQNAGRPEASVNNSMIVMANSLKEANFDLARGETNEGKNVYDLRLCNSLVKNDIPINGYWCPFIQGNTLPGYVDIPRYNPIYRFVFTPAMNGCAFVVTNSPKGRDWFRVYHNQHPGMRSVTDLIRRESGEDLFSYFSFNDYGTQNNPNAFNFLHYRNSTWMYVSQPQIFTINTHGFGIGYRPGGIVVTQSIF